LETTLKDIEDAEFEIAKHEADSQMVALLRQLRNAHIDLASTLKRSIESKMKATIRCESVRIKQELHEAVMELVDSENGMGALEGGSMTQRWDRLRVATDRWWSALHASWNHRSTCQICIANR
jgi:hypothetical protein